MEKIKVGDRVMYRNPEDRGHDGLKAVVVHDFDDGDYLVAFDEEGKGWAYRDNVLVQILCDLLDIDLDYDKAVHYIAHKENLFAEVKDDGSKYKVGDQVHLKERRARLEDVPGWAVWVVKEVYGSPSVGYSYKVKCNKSENMSVEIICDADDLVEITAKGVEQETEKKMNEKKPEQKPKFKVGDRVIANALATDKYYHSVTRTGWTGVVDDNDYSMLGGKRWIRVRDSELGIVYSVVEEAFDLYSARLPKRHIVIEITDDGATGKYVVGKKVEKTAEIRRSPEDEPDDYAAAEYILEKLAGKTLGGIHALREFADEIGRVTDDFKKKLGK